MINPPPRDTTLSESKYSLVIAVSKRARQIVARREPLIQGHKPVSAALDEIIQGKVRIIKRSPETDTEPQE